MTHDLDTESRLRGYLNARAEAYPDSAVPPGLPTEPAVRRGRWPVLLAAAAIVAVLAVTVTAVRVLDRDQAPATAGNALAVPYVLNTEDSATLHDGDTTVKLADPVTHDIIGRVADGWVVRKLVERDEPLPPDRFQTAVDQVGIVDRSGRFTPVGPQEAMSAVLSPDRTKVVMVNRNKDNSARMAVFDLASRKREASIPVQANVAVQGWNSHGIWLFEHSTSSPVGVSVWRPGEPRPRRIGGVTTDGTLVVANTTDRIVVEVTRDAGRCLRVMQPRATTLTAVREYCYVTAAQAYPELSTDGRYMLVLNDSLAIELDTGRQVPVDVPPGERGVMSSYPETATNFLVVIPQPAETDPTPTPVRSGDVEAVSLPIPGSLVSRCETTSGACTPALRVPAGTSIDIGKP